MNYPQFVLQYNTIKAKGFIKSQRTGDGAAGNTFEDELGLKENNIAAPDIDNYEIKTFKKGASGLQTLFNKEGEWQMTQIEFLKRYGFPHTKKKGELSAQSTVKKTPNSNGYYFTTDDHYLYVKVNDVIIVKWNFDLLLSKFAEKFPNCIKVLADVKKIDGEEWFHYNEAYLFEGTTKEKFRELIEDDLISIDFRLYTRYNENKGIRNRGTAFRIKHEDMDKLFIKEAIV